MNRTLKNTEKVPAAAFTLIELLVVLAIISILTAILFPVFARARENARRASCLSNLQQIGLAFLQYTQDYDERYPLSSYQATASDKNISWTVTAQPYMKSVRLFRCPSDEGLRWTTPASPANGNNYYTTSYIMNAWIAGSSKYGCLAAINSPSKFIILVDANTNYDPLQRDHFHPFYWVSNDPDVTPSAFMHNQTWNSSTDETYEIALRRHLEAFNSLCADGHAKATRWSQAWFEDPPNGILEGNFDPRQ